MPTASVDTLCPRCLQATPARAKRCPHCGDRLPGGRQSMTIVLGAIGVLFLAGIIALAVWLEPFSDETGDSSQPARQSAPAAKKPPLN